MKKLKLFLIAQMFGSIGLFAQLQTLINYGNPSLSEGSQLNTRMIVTKLTMPAGIGFDIREIGVNMHSSSLAGTIRFGFYDENGSFLAQTPLLNVQGGSEYVSFNIEPGSLEIAAGTSLSIGIMTSSPDVVYGFIPPLNGSIPPNNGCGSVYGFMNRVSNLTYPNIPSSVNNWDAQIGGLLALVVKASPLPIGVLGISESSGIPNDGTICEGTSVTLLSPIVTTGLSWNTSSTSAAINVSPTGTSTYTLTLTRGSCFVTQSQVITVLPGVTANLVVSDTSGFDYDDGIICSGTGVQLIATNDNSFTYNWGNSETSNILTVTPTATVNYYLTITNTDGCEKELQATIIVNENPTLSWGQNNPLCHGENIIVTVVVNGGTPDYTAQWSTGVMVQPSTQTMFSEHLPAGDYSFGVYDANYCYAIQSFTLIEPELLTNEINPIICPGSTFTIGSDNYSNPGTYTTTLSSIYGCDSVVTINLSFSNPVNVSTTTTNFTISATASGATYQWINCATNQAIEGATSQTYTATANGDYAVIVTQNDCSDTSACVTISTIGINELNASFNLYPNPATSTVTIASSQMIEQIVITDLSGKVISILTEKGMNQTIDVSDLSRGMYLVKVSSQGNQITKQFVKE